MDVYGPTFKAPVEQVIKHLRHHAHVRVMQKTLSLAQPWQDQAIGPYSVLAVGCNVPHTALDHGRIAWKSDGVPP